MRGRGGLGAGGNGHSEFSLGIAIPHCCAVQFFVCLAKLGCQLSDTLSSAPARSKTPALALLQADRLRLDRGKGRMAQSHDTTGREVTEPASAAPHCCFLLVPRESGVEGTMARKLPINRCPICTMPTRVCLRPRRPTQAGCRLLATFSHSSLNGPVPDAKICRRTPTHSQLRCSKCTSFIGLPSSSTTWSVNCLHDTHSVKVTIEEDPQELL